jgi:diguanylate cyclase (GGDEF)-like protein
MFFTIDTGISRSLKSYTWLVIVVWTGAILLSLLLNMRTQDQEVLEMAKTQARISFQKDLFYRLWITGHGGVYVPVTPQTPPNPYLHVEERDITSPSGRSLTLINPAYMTRQVNELARSRYKVISHLTSLQPIRPENAPDAWERQALLGLRQGAKEFGSLELLNGQQYLRMMFPYVTEAKCLKCHANQGYKLGDAHGGLSIAVPTNQLQSIVDRKSMLFGHLGLWSLGVVLIGAGGRRLRRSIERQFEMEDALKESVEENQRLAYFDSLTGLPNRTLFQDRLGQSLAQAAREQKVIGILFLDLDRFNIINDTLGHVVGDDLLKAVSSRLQRRVRKADTVARLGSDEFVIILASINSEEDIIPVVQDLLEITKAPIMVAGQEISSAVSIGIAVYPFDGSDPGTLLQHAEVAMFKGKEQGGNAYQFYCPEMHMKAMERLAMEQNLRRALAKEEFSLHVQPKVSLADGRISGMEVLLRWRNDELGQVEPSRFIPVAEEIGLINGIGRWVLETACRQNRAWQDAGLPAMPVAVNISGCQLKHHGFVDEVAEILAATGLEAGWLELELTESILMENVPEATGKLRQLKALGVQISIDDFGTGYSSLNYLKRFPIDKLKIDRSFVMDIPASADDAAIARAIIAMAHSLHLQVIAEGVETAEQLAFLAADSCDEIQGYYISRPVPVQEFAAVYRRLLPSAIQPVP